MIDLATIPTLNIDVNKFMTTQQLWSEIMEDKPWEHFEEMQDNYPATFISWSSCLFFCNMLSEREGLDPYYLDHDDEPIMAESYNPKEVKLAKHGQGFRLLTHQEWNHVARANSNTRYAGSNRVNEVGWYLKNSVHLMPVGQKAANNYGIFDMSGNSWEWCEDWSQQSNNNKKIAKGGAYNTDLDYLIINTDRYLPLSVEWDKIALQQQCTISFRFCRNRE